MKKIIYILTAVIFISGCGRKEIHRVSRPLLGTIINLTLIADAGSAAKASSAAFDEIRRIEDLMSPYRQNSDIYNVNKYAGMKAVKISSETFSIISKSAEVSDETDGAFDITFASMGGIWNYKDKNFTPPSSLKIKSLLYLVNYKNIELLQDNSVKFKFPGTKIGLGAIAKGYAVKKAVEVMKSHGVESGIAEEGGDLQVFGRKFREKWKTGLVHPRKKEIFLSIDLDDMESIATSGDYERFAEYKGRRYHHILDPKTGMPAETFSSVSVICKDPVDADAYATAIFVMGLEKSKKFLKSRKDISVILVDLDLKLYISVNLKDKIKIFDHSSVIWF